MGVLFHEEGRLHRGIPARSLTKQCSAPPCDLNGEGNHACVCVCVCVWEGCRRRVSKLGWKSLQMCKFEASEHGQTSNIFLGEISRHDEGGNDHRIRGRKRELSCVCVFFRRLVLDYEKDVDF